jgi:hypothetical protein
MRAMPPRRRSTLERERATKLPLFKFLLIVGALLTLGVLGIGSYFERPASDAIGASPKGRANASLGAKNS